MITKNSFSLIIFTLLVIPFLDSCKSRSNNSEVLAKKTSFSPDFSVMAIPVKKDDGILIYDLKSPNENMSPDSLKGRTLKLRGSQGQNNVLIYQGALLTPPLIVLEDGNDVLPTAPKRILDQKSTSLGSALVILSNHDQDAVNPLTVTLDVNAPTDLDLTRVAIYYQKLKYSNDGIQVSGMIPNSQLELSRDAKQIHAKFRTSHWGAYQAVQTANTLADGLEVSSVVNLKSRAVFNNDESKIVDEPETFRIQK